MKKLFILVGFMAITSTLTAQAPPACNSNNCNTNTTINNCPVGSTTVVTSFTNATQKPGNPCGNGLCVGSVWRFASVATQSGKTINAEIQVSSITNAVLNSIDDNISTGVGPALFAPRIGPDVDLGTVTNRRGWVEFIITFYDASLGNGYITTQQLENLNFVHYDIDGNGNNNSWFREMGHIKRVNITNPAIQAYSATELSADAYTVSGVTWTGFLGSVCERDDVSSCAEVAVQAAFSAPQSSVTVRMGYDSKNGGNGQGSPVRQYGARFGCFQFPSIINLPVKLNNFIVRKTGEQTVGLNWQTATEQNNRGFQVQRRFDNEAGFSDIAFINSQGLNGNSSSTLNYNYNDNISPAIRASIAYYRLMQTDANGRITYSEIQPVRLNINGKVEIFPNPAVNGRIEIVFGKANSNSSVQVFDMSSRMIQSIAHINGTRQVVEGLNAGVYYVKITDPATEEVIVKRVVVTSK